MEKNENREMERDKYGTDYTLFYFKSKEKFSRLRDLIDLDV